MWGERTGKWTLNHGQRKLKHCVTWKDAESVSVVGTTTPNRPDNSAILSVFIPEEVMKYAGKFEAWKLTAPVAPFSALRVIVFFFVSG